MSDDGASNQPKTRLWQRPLPLQRQDSNKNDFIDREFITRLQTLPNELPAELQWQDFEPRMCKDIARFYHENFMLGCGTPPAQFEKFIEYRMCANPPHLILMIVDSHSRERPESGTEKGLSGKIIGMMMSESFDVLNQGKRVPVLTIGGLAIASEWRGMGLVINLVKRGASRVSGEHMHLFNLKKDRRLFPCAELNVWWYPLKAETALKMTLFRLTPPPPSLLISALAERVNESYGTLPCRPMTTQDVSVVCEMLREESMTFSLARYWTPEHVARWLLPKEGVQYSYIVTDDIGEELVDFFSFHITSFNTPDDIEGLKEAEKSNTREIKAVVPGYLTTKNTRRDDIVRYIMYAGKHAGADYIHGYGAFAYCEAFSNLGFVKNENEVHYLQMFNWETRTFKGSEIGLQWIQF